MPLVSVVIPCYQEQRFIVPCLESVLGFELPAGWAMEIFAIDGASTDGTRELVQDMIAREPRIRLLSNPRRTQAHALNLGIASSRGEYVLRLDAHSTYPADYLAKCIETALRTRANNVGGRVRTMARGDGYQASLVQALTTHPFGVGSSFRTDAKEGPADTVPFGFFRRDTFDTFGMFDERLVRAQDYEFNKRVTSRGGVVWLNPHIVLDYFQQPTLARFLGKQLFLDAPYNAYMWYLAPYTFTPRHAVTAVFATGVLIGVPLAFFVGWIRVVVLLVLGLYLALAVGSAAQQAARYKRPAHLLLLPFAFFAYHALHGIGVLAGLARIAIGAAPVTKSAPAWTAS